MAPVVAAFLHAHPRVSIDLHLTDAVQNLDRDRIDLAVRIGSSGEDHYLIRRIADNHRLLVASPRYLERRPIACVEDLDVCDGLLLGNAPTWRLQGPNGRIHIARPRGRLKCVSGDTLLAMCASDLGVALKSFWDVRRALDDGRLVHVLPEWTQGSPANIMIVMPDRRLVSPTLRALGAKPERSLRSALAEPRSQAE